MTRHLLVVPSLACPARCSYCFGPHESGPIMSRETVEAVVRWQDNLFEKDGMEITFHGGEPLVAGAEFYRMALSLLSRGLAARNVHFAVQSNLWLLSDNLCDIFREYDVSLGTSLDGPEDINNDQRGRGNFQRTMAGIERARTHGLDVGCICTFTNQSLPHVKDIFEFFVQERLNFSIHAALPSLRRPDTKENGWSLSPEAYGALLLDVLNLYLPNLTRIRIRTLDSMCRSVSSGNGGICTFGDCLGGYLSVGPNGDIYPCQRFVGMPEYRLATVHECPSQEDLAASPAWRTFQKRQDRITEECYDCPYLKICRGGCPYNALRAGGGRFNTSQRDPYCPAYKRFFSRITEQGMDEVFARENLEDVVDRADPARGLLRRGRLISLMRDAPHPYDTARNARSILAATALAATGSPDEAARKLHSIGLLSRLDSGEVALRNLHERLSKPVRGLNNLYLHVTFGCNLHCTHCYADAGGEREGALSGDDIARACREAAKLGFRHVVITGGEPLMHPQRDEMLDALSGLCREVKPLLTVLRTNLAFHADRDLLRRLGRSTDEVVVSVDGDRETHDVRRGRGAYDLTVANLRALVEMGCETDLSLACVLPLNLVKGAPGDSVRALAKELGIRRTRFKPLLPLGRARDSAPDIIPETVWAHLGPRDVVSYGFTPAASCGMGQNLYVEPDGSAYPCYAWHGKRRYLGHINRDNGLSGVIRSEAFRKLGTHTVNTNRRCGRCALRYVCGGACRAWSRQLDQEQTDLDAPAEDCSRLHDRARSLLVSALEHLEITTEQWIAAGLPLPDMPAVFAVRSEDNVCRVSVVTKG
jgi:uncharacterized protein